jgi:hypothetical protein
MGRRGVHRASGARPPLEQILSSTIRVPADRLDERVDSLAMSAMLAHALRYAPRVVVLSDLNGCSLSQLADKRPLRRRVLRELYDLLKELGGIVRAKPVAATSPRAKTRIKANFVAQGSVDEVRKAIRPASKPFTKADFVRSMPASMPPKLVVAAANAQGLSIALGYVYEVRADSGIPLPRNQLAARAAIDVRSGPSYERDPSVNQPPRLLLSTLDRLIQDFVDAVLLAVRRASLADLEPRAPDSIPAPRVSLPTEAPRLSSGTPRARRAPPTSRRAPHQRQPALRVVAAVDEHLEGLIVDPAGILQPAEPPRHAPQATPQTAADSAPAVLSPRTAPKAAPARPRSAVATVGPEALPLANDTQALTATSPGLREGEEALRTASGGLVLRRQRHSSTAPTR